MHCICICDLNGDILAEKHYDNVLNRKDLETIPNILKCHQILPPIVSSLGYLLIIHQKNDVLLISISENEVDSSFIASILVEIGNTLDNVIKKGILLETMKTDFALAYQILDQYLDSGFPFLDEPNVLLATRFHNLNKNIDIDPKYPWRSSFLPKNLNEFHIEHEETIDTRINHNGKLEFLQIRGDIKCQSILKSTPTVNLAFTVPGKLEDYSFHRCVDPSLFLSRRLSFVPPEGHFTLFSYLTRPKLPSLPIFIIPKLSWSNVGVIFDIALRIDPLFQSRFVYLSIRMALPDKIVAPSLATASGSVNYHPQTKEIIWDVDTNSKKEFLSLSGSASIEDNICKEGVFFVLSSRFEIKGVSLSGIKIDSVEIPGINKFANITINTTKSGKYDFIAC